MLIGAGAVSVTRRLQKDTVKNWSDEGRPRHSWHFVWRYQSCEKSDFLALELSTSSELRIHALAPCGPAHGEGDGMVFGLQLWREQLSGDSLGACHAGPVFLFVILIPEFF
jgi:hypothetical protein